MSKKINSTTPAFDAARAVRVRPYEAYGRAVAFEIPRPETDDVLLFTDKGEYVGERAGRKPAARPEAAAPALVTVRVKDQPVDGPGCRAFFAGETFETTAEHAALLGKLVEAVPAAAATATQIPN